MSAATGAGGLPGRSEVAVVATRIVNEVSRRLGLGSGTVAGGRVGLAIDPSLLARLGAGRVVALVSGTNGKTTTTRLLATAVAAEGEAVVTNATGSNMPAGHLASLVTGPRTAPAVLEVDEAYLPQSVNVLGPAAVVLLNLSRDQLDRTNEVRMLAGRWRAALGGAHGTTVVANADDPLVVWGALGAQDVVWVAAGIGWRNDAVGCPACGGRIVFGEAGSGPDSESGGAVERGGWACTSCDFRRPLPDVSIEEWGDGESVAVMRDGRRVPVAISLPGRFNRANALMSAVAAQALGRDLERSLRAMAAVEDVAGRFTVRSVGGVRARLLLAKNPAGWAELLHLVRVGTDPVVVAINARVADGRDPSWLWDVPFESLAGRVVVASGDRCRDLSVRLHYAGVAHETIGDPSAAVAAAARSGAVARAAGAAEAGTAQPAVVQFVGNYTAFNEVLGLSTVERGDRR